MTSMRQPFPDNKILRTSKLKMRVYGYSASPAPPPGVSQIPSCKPTNVGIFFARPTHFPPLITPRPLEQELTPLPMQPRDRFSTLDNQDVSQLLYSSRVPKWGGGGK